MWTHNNKQIIIAINTELIQHIQFDDGTEEKGKNAIKLFKRGIFVNPNLNKKKYLSLLKIFHPDVSDLNIDLATQISQAIISAKDGTATVVNPKKANYRSSSNTQSSTSNSSASSSSNYYSWWQQYTSRQSNQQQEDASYKSSQHKPEQDFETLVDCIPKNYWKILGEFDTFQRDRLVDFRLFKRCYYGYFDTELEIVLRNGFIYREKITAIHSNCFHILHQLNLNCLTKNDLRALCVLGKIAFNKSQRKADLVETIYKYCFDSFGSTSKAEIDYWTIVVSSSRPVWKDKFIKPEYHHNFEQFAVPNRHDNTPKQEDTSSYLNCGQYLKLKRHWLERDEFLYFLRLTRNLAKKLDVVPTECDGYPAYPLSLLDKAWLKLSL